MRKVCCRVRDLHVHRSNKCKEAAGEWFAAHSRRRASCRPSSNTIGFDARGRKILISNQRCKIFVQEARKAFSQVRCIILKEFQDLWQCNYLDPWIGILNFTKDHWSISWWEIVGLCIYIKRKIILFEKDYALEHQKKEKRNREKKEWERDILKNKWWFYQRFEVIWASSRVKSRVCLSFLSLSQFVPLIEVNVKYPPTTIYERKRCLLQDKTTWTKVLHLFLFNH